MTLTSTAFADGGPIPEQHTCEGADTSPPLAWRDAPPGTRSFALVVVDPDAPTRTWTHWLVWDIDAQRTGLQTNEAARDVVFGTTDFGRVRYNGPCPPKGHGVHRYEFRLYALDVAELPLQSGADRRAVEQAMQGHVLGQAVLVGTYERAAEPVTSSGQG